MPSIDKRRLAADTARRAFAYESGLSPGDPAELLGQLLAGLQLNARELAGSDALWGEAVAVMRRALEESS
jgi:hypothetical protein